MLPIKEGISNEEIQLIFKIRSRVINVKPNMKGIYDAHECKVCQKEDETQKHIYECEEIWKIKNKSHDEIPKYVVQ